MTTLVEILLDLVLYFWKKVVFLRNLKPFDGFHWNQPRFHFFLREILRFLRNFGGFMAKMRSKMTKMRVSNFTTPVRPMKKNFYCAVVVVVVGRIYHSKYFCVKISCIFFLFFFKSFKLLGGTILIFFFQSNKPKIELVGRKLTQKATLFARLTSVISPIWGSKKSFSGLFRNFFWVFLEVFRHCFRP